ncbi:Na+/H+ antiporter NhaC family protein [Planococcus glaciei]|uniref:Na+/H+ antiporter NhaC family protein n=1 Tax=Planococcus glaciei TaxID=459472 RepID=A0A7H8QD52_9BACL|nr:Na+/H+ antiporter NhaC family protein [Planococcus glaciei]ETP68218.1 sodium:proton antiporter [Planococcus glaciei CHR43]MBX0316040.1 Na+/H+ antiporter NhaC family protein [Planococcus glaciei]QDY46108.1 Na+/H+ antiporter NhaC family protein [Planococcus glaciei]QKX51482.1 Na+/H+ antiporter NhaC family protein [Planococcus glaciei]
MENTIFSILPPIIAIVMVLLTRRVLLSLGAGIVAGALILTSFAPLEALREVYNSFAITFWDEGFNAYNVFIILFLLLLGIITAFVSLSGGSHAFAEWAATRIKSRRGAKVLTVFLGIVIFIDDYFNALAVGQVAKPITDRYKISRAKLAYFIDSTAAPVCVISPVSSWGAAIIGIIATILAEQTYVQSSALEAFVLMAPMNFYAIATLAIVFFVAVRDVDFGAMKKHETRAIVEGQLFDPKKTIPGELKEEFPSHSHGRVRDLLLPILLLVAGTILSMIWTGYQNAGQVFDIWLIFENTDVPASLLTGGLLGAATSIVLYLLQMKHNKTANAAWVGKGIVAGIKSMAAAVFILIFAWSLSYLIGALETGLYLSEIVTENNVPIEVLPVLLFALAGVMAFSTGTSWGSFGILLPIAGNIMAQAAPELLLPALSAVLAGAVFGDHCSPISDTTILSSTGAGSNHMDHVLTQLPYALTAAGIAAIGYIVIGFTESLLLSLGTVMVILLILFVAWSRRTTILEKRAKTL